MNKTFVEHKKRCFSFLDVGGKGGKEIQIISGPFGVRRHESTASERQQMKMPASKSLYCSGFTVIAFIVPLLVSRKQLRHRRRRLRRRIPRST